jgi:branched-subunit amino acid transport protein
MDLFYRLAHQPELWGWVLLALASLGTYLWRGLGVLLSGKISQDGPLFRWITCVTYAMVAALVVRIIVLPVGALSQVPLIYRCLSVGAALAVMMARKNALVPALTTGTALMVLFGWIEGLR